jgi:hypothetical protein
MKTIKDFKSLKRHAKNQVNAQQVLNGRMYTNDGWEQVKVTNEFRELVANQVCETLGGRDYTKEAVKQSLLDGTQHWGVERMIFEDYTNPGFRYCAGQDYPTEIKTIRNFLRK